MTLRAKVLTHVRCHMDDARVAVETGADGIDVLFGTSSALRTFSHGKSVDQIIESGTEVVRFIQARVTSSVRSACCAAVSRAWW